MPAARFRTPLPFCATLSALRKVEELRVQARMLEMEKFAATGRLAGTIAHEVNNPMEAIKNSIHLLQNRVKPGAEPVYEILKSETDRVARIVRQMLGLYRSSSQVGGFDINRVVEDTITLFGRQLERSGVTTSLESGKDSAGCRQRRPVPPDPLQPGGECEGRNGATRRSRHLFPMARVQFLIRSCGSTFALRAPVRRCTGRVVVTIADTGSGIPQNIRDSMFEPFVSSKGEKGTGWASGLSAESPRVTAARYGFAVRKAAAPSSRSICRWCEASAMADKQKSRSWLVVDDERNVLLTYRMLLEQEGYDATASLTAKEAIRLLEKEKFDILLCDLSLEEKRTGFEVINAARERNAGVPAVLLTGYASPEAAEYAKENDVAVLYKPIEIEEFLKTIATLLKENHA